MRHTNSAKAAPPPRDPFRSPHRCARTIRSIFATPPGGPWAIRQSSGRFRKKLVAYATNNSKLVVYATIILVFLPRRHRRLFRAARFAGDARRHDVSPRRAKAPRLVRRLRLHRNDGVF